MYYDLVTNIKKIRANLSQEEKIAIIRLFRSENIGAKTFSLLYSMYGSAIKALEAAPELARKGGRTKNLTIVSKDSVIKEIESLSKFGAQIITFADPEYPAHLLQIPDFPPVLTIRGRKELLLKNKIAVVGARNASVNGLAYAAKIAKEIGAAGYVVISGLARGIDTAAHRASLATGTIGVIAGGIDNVYPEENSALYAQLFETGLVVAEMPFGASPKAQHFPQRNRIISGLSQGLIVIEASLKSGSLITAKMALDHNRDVFAVPGSPLDPRSAGCNSLIKNGAYLLDNVRDVIDTVAGRFDIVAMHEAKQNNFSSFNMHTILDEKVLNEARAIIYSCLTTSGSNIDEIMSASGYNLPIIFRILLELELAGRVERQRGNKVALIYRDEELIINEN